MDFIDCDIRQKNQRIISFRGRENVRDRREKPENDNADTRVTLYCSGSKPVVTFSL